MSDLIALRPDRPRRACRRATTATALYALGCALEATDPEAAMAAYRKAARARPWLGDAHCNLGRLQHEAGDAAAAEASYRRALAADPSIALYHYNLGVALEDLGRAADAVAAYQAALEREPTLAEASHNLARLGR